MGIWTIYTYTIVFLLGAVIGSFLNVCIYRIPAGLSIVKPRSRCGDCGKTLEALDLVPIFSWLFLRGKCRHCGAKIAARYPMVEALEGILFVVILSHFGISWLTPIMWVFTAILTVVFFIDLDHQIIPNKVVIFGLVAGLMPAVYHWISTAKGPTSFHRYPLYFSTAFYEPFLGAFVPFVLMLAMALLSLIFFKRSGLGMGDVKLYAVIGTFLGWQNALMSIWFAFFFGGLFGIIWIFILKKDKSAMIPFAPFIVVGSLLTMFYSAPLYNFIF